MNEVHIGYFRLVDDKTKKVLARYNYDKITAKERKQLRENMKNASLFCDCIPEDKIELKIASNLVIYSAQKNVGELHHINCPKYKSADSKDWTYDSSTRTYRASSYVEAQDYVRRLNRLVFQDVVYTDRFDSIKNIRMAAKKISTNAGIKLNTIINPVKFVRGQDYFVYMFLGKIIASNGRLVKLMCIEDNACKKTIEVYADQKQFDDYFSESKYYIVGEDKCPILVGGWVYLDDNDNLILTDFWVRATGQNGKLFF